MSVCLNPAVTGQKEPQSCAFCVDAGLRSGSTGDLSEVHSHLLAMRLQSGLEGVEVGPQIGRGSYGCVYKV